MGDFHQHLTVQNSYETPRQSRRESVEAMSARRSERPQKGRLVLDGKGDHEIGTCDMVIVYCIMKEMSILSGRISVPGIVAVKRENGKKDYSVLTCKWTEIRTWNNSREKGKMK
nr:hypothetical protein [Tanacetum cinerariifolium]